MDLPAEVASVPAVFRFHSTAIRTFADDHGEPWFAAADVCKVLGYGNTRQTVQDHCRSYGVSKRYTIDSMGREQEITVINEPNLYRLIIKSRKPEAEKFEVWVMEEVLPSIRKQGRYEVAPGQKASHSQIQSALRQRVLATERQRRYRQRKTQGGWRQATHWVREGEPISAPGAAIRLLIEINGEGRQRMENVPSDAYIIRLKDIHELVASQGLRLVREEDLKRLEETAINHLADVMAVRISRSADLPEASQRTPGGLVTSPK